jgi:hypothetical protein
LQPVPLQTVESVLKVIGLLRAVFEKSAWLPASCSSGLAQNVHTVAASPTHWSLRVDSTNEEICSSWLECWKPLDEKLTPLGVVVHIKKAS